MSGVRGSQLLIPTLKDDPTDAEAISHKLLVRGGFIRQVGSGLYTYLPLGWRVMRQIDTIIREEMDTIGQEMLMPVLNPAELWQRTGRWDIEQLYKLTDSSGKHYALAMTHEECVTFHASREIRSYKELPQIWYHIQTKERDEPRPKSGILRTREFIMKDSYSLDRDEEGLEASYQRHIEVYKRIYDRCGLEYWMVESDVGMMGGLGAHEFMAPSSAGEDEVALCSSCDYAANVELARSRPRTPQFPERLDAPQQIETPGATTIEALAGPARDRPGGHRQGDGAVQGRRGRAAAGPRRRSHARAEGDQGAGRRVPAGHAGGDRCHVWRRARLDRAGRRGHAGDRRRGVARGPVRVRRQPHRLPSAGRGGRSRLHARVRGPARSARR